MKIFCKELNQEFDTKQEMFKVLKSKKEDLIGLKKSQIKMSQAINYSIKNDSSVKEENREELKIGDIVKVAMNTTNYYDYDGDVLVDGSWSKTANEQTGRTYHVADHKLEMGKIVAYPKDVSISVENIEWSRLGKSYPGSTEVLIFNSKMTDKTNQDVFMAYRDGEKIEHSIRLIYVKIKLAINSDEAEDKEEKAVWDTYYNKVANKEEMDEYGYAWIVTEAKIYKEGSTVLFGANDATPSLKEEVIEPEISTQKSDNQPPQSTDMDYDFLINNIFKQ